MSNYARIIKKKRGKLKSPIDSTPRTENIKDIKWIQIQLKKLRPKNFFFEKSITR